MGDSARLFAIQGLAVEIGGQFVPCALGFGSNLKEAISFLERKVLGVGAVDVFEEAGGGVSLVVAKEHFDVSK